MNVNSVVRGDIPENLKSGAALALVQSLAVESNGQFQAAIVRCDERIASGIFSLLKKYAANKRTVEIVGAAQAGSVMEWSKDDIQTIDRVTIGIGTALQNTESGKLEIANNLMVQGLVKTASEYIEVLETGRLEPILKAPKAGLDLIAWENELLIKGNPPAGPPTPVPGPDGQPLMGPQGPVMKPNLSVQARMTDDHAIHVTEHAAVMSDKSVRTNPALTKAVMDHIQEHEQFFSNMGPILGILTKQSVQPPPPPPPPGMAPPAGPPPAGPLGSHVPPPPGGRPANAPLPVDAHKARPLGHEPPPAGGPGMPTNPLTGARAPQSY